MLKVIKTRAEYDTAMAELEELVLTDPEIGTPEADRMELLTLLVQDYESRTGDIDIPDPIEALLFRMEQQGLSQRDLVPFLGTRSRVSEILARKRPLTLPMMRALHKHLGIPATILLHERNSQELSSNWIDWNQFPIKEMLKRGWLSPYMAAARDNVQEAVRLFFSTLGPLKDPIALYRKTHHVRTARSINDYALKAWTARIVIRAQEDPPTNKYSPGTIDIGFMSKLAKLSWSEQGPCLAREFLKNHGISLVIEPHLPQTHLDGAALMIRENWPVIGLSLRHDRIDNFWFTLMHELAHIVLHMINDDVYFYDDLDVTNEEDTHEREADAMAGEALIPSEEWAKSAASRLKSPEAAEHLAKKLGISPAIVAGRMRREFKSYRILNQLVGHKQVRRCFTEVSWEE